MIAETSGCLFVLYYDDSSGKEAVSIVPILVALAHRLLFAQGKHYLPAKTIQVSSYGVTRARFGGKLPIKPRKLYKLQDRNLPL